MLKRARLTRVGLLSKSINNYSDLTRTLAYSYEYNTDGTLKKFTNHLDGSVLKYTYDHAGNITKATRQHKAYCVCGSFTYKAHEYLVTPKGRTCKRCGYLAINTPVTPITGTTPGVNGNLCTVDRKEDE